MTREAAIDIGTNTMLLLITDVEPASRPSHLRKIGQVYEDHIRFVRLGQGVHQNRAFAPEAMQRALTCFHDYRALCDKHKVDRVYAIATSASRDSQNATEFYNRVRKETGIDVQIIAGETEAKLSFLGGLLPFQDKDSTAILDIGGGSTEFVTWQAKEDTVFGQSIDIGSVRATEMFLKGDPYDMKSVRAMTDYLTKLWSQITPSIQEEIRSKEWTGIAGTPTTLAGIMLNMSEFDGDKVDGYKIKVEEIREWFEKLARQSNAERAAQPLMGTGRADVMVAGVGILLTAMEVFGKKQVVVSSRGLRHGVLLSPLSS
jgi:exopolyphosphatase/guanosine-5'-triphosphate,3'-diphosphate pyrophosphatase